MRTVRRLSAAVTAGLLAITLASCAESARDSGAAQGGGAGAGGGTLVFGAPGAPDNFDPAFAQDGETFRPARQMFDTLITYKLGTSELAAGAGHRVDAERRLHPVDVQAPRGRDLPRRHAVQRRGGLLQLRPLVQPQGRGRADPGLLLRRGVRGLRPERDRGRAPRRSTSPAPHRIRPPRWSR